MAHVLEHWFKQVPIVTRCCLTATVLTTIGWYLEIVTPFTLYLNLKLMFGEFQLWRLVTNCLYLGKLDLGFFLQLYYMVVYCKEFEEKTFRGRTADFLHDFIWSYGYDRSICGASITLPSRGVSSACLIIHQPIYHEFFLRSPLFMVVMDGGVFWVWLLVIRSISLKKYTQE